MGSVLGCRRLPSDSRATQRLHVHVCIACRIPGLDRQGDSLTQEVPSTSCARETQTGMRAMCLAQHGAAWLEEQPPQPVPVLSAVRHRTNHCRLRSSSDRSIPSRDVLSRKNTGSQVAQSHAGPELRTALRSGEMLLHSACSVIYGIHADSKLTGSQLECRGSDM